MVFARHAFRITSGNVNCFFFSDLSCGVLRRFEYEYEKDAYYECISGEYEP